MLFLIGFIVGVAMSAPVGGVNIMCLRKTLRFGFATGLATALGAVLADCFFAAIAIFGVSHVSVLIAEYEFFIQMLGGITVIIFGYVILRQAAQKTDQTSVQRADPGGPVSAFILTITNPGAVFGFIAFFSTLSRFVPPPSDFIGSLMVLSGVASGCVLWWVLLAGFAARYRHQLSDRTIGRINRIAGFLLLGFGAVILIRLFVKSFIF